MTNINKHILYSFRRCPYAMRARLAITAMGIPVSLREVVLKDKPEEMIQASPKATVPVLLLSNGTVIDESLDIMKWAMTQNRYSHEHSTITSPTAEMLMLIEKIDGPFKHHLDRYKYENRYIDEGAISLEHRDANIPILQELDSRLEKQNYLFGDEITFADIAIAPFIRQYANTNREWFDSTSFNALQRWLSHFCSSTLFTNVMNKYKPWKETREDITFPKNL